MTSNQRNNNKSSSIVRRVSSDDNNNENQPSSHQQQTQQQQQLPESFPIKLHRILEDAEINSFEDVISWIPSNNGFKVHDPKSFEDDIMPKYFNNTKYKSFQRQLNMWNFERQNSSGPNLNLTLMKKSLSPSGIDAACPPKGSYLHLCFIRGKPELCSKMDRIKIKGILSKKKKRKSSIANNNSNGKSAAVVAAASAVTNNESLILAQSRVAHLQRKKEEIERKLSSITQQMEYFPPRPNHHNNSATTTTNSSHFLPRVSYNSNMDIDSSGVLNNDFSSSKRRGSIGSTGSIGTIGSGNGLIRCSSIDTIQSLLGEGDSLCFEGKTFHFAADHNHHQHQGSSNNNNSNDRWNVTPADQPQQQQQRRRSVGRRYSLELVDSESDEYVLKELEESIELGTGLFGAATANATMAAAAPATTATIGTDSGDGSTTRSGSSSNQNIPFVDTRSSTYNKPLLSHRVSLQDQSNNDSSNDNSNNNSITTIPFSIPTKLNNYVQGATSSSSNSRSRRSSSNSNSKNKNVTGENFLSNNMPLFHLNLDRPRRRFSLTSTSVHDPFENNNLREMYNKLQDEQQQQQQQQAQYNLMKATTEQQQQQAQYNLMKATTRMTSAAEKIANNFFPSSSNVNVIDNGSIKMSPRVSF